MPRATNRFARTEQAFAWLLNHFPPGRVVHLEWKDECRDYATLQKDPKILGQVTRDGSDLVIELKRVRCPGCLLTTLWHEYAHVLTWGPARDEDRREEHPAHFYTLVGEIESLWNEIGHEEANDY